MGPWWQRADRAGEECSVRSKNAVTGLDTLFWDDACHVHSRFAVEAQNNEKTGMKNKDSEQHYPESYSIYIYLLIYESYFTQRLMIGIWLRGRSCLMM